MKNKTIVILFFLLMIISIVAMGFFVVNRNQELSEKIDEETNKIEENENSGEKKEEEKDESYIITNSKGEDILVDPNKEKEDIDSFETSKLKAEVNDKISSFDFLEAHEFVYEESLKYNDESMPEDINVLLEDTAIMSNVKGVLNSGDNDIAVSLVKSLKNEDVFLIGTLFLEDTERRYIIETTESINPVFYGDIEIISKENISDSYKEENIFELNRLENVREVYKHEFKIEGNRIWSYIARTDERLRFIKMIQDENNEITYYTIEEWDENFE
jgi:Na+-transporting methylmalonyl-CoA/oxaloacetate decarboxylase gamma subunit